MGGLILRELRQFLLKSFEVYRLNFEALRKLRDQELRRRRRSLRLSEELHHYLAVQPGIIRHLISQSIDSTLRL